MILLKYVVCFMIHTYACAYILYGYIYSHSPPGTGGTHASGEETNGATTSSLQYDDKVLYAAPAQTVIVPHQTVSTGDMYAVSTKAVGKTSQEQPPAGESNGVHDATSDPKRHPEGVSSYSYGVMNYCVTV